MEFPFNCKELFNADLNGIVMLDSNQINKKQEINFYRICKIIDVFCGHPSGKRNKPEIITTAENFLNSKGDKIIFQVKENKVYAFLRFGQRLIDSIEENYNKIQLYCLIDFYVYYNKQRQGIGKLLCDKMLRFTANSPEKIGIFCANKPIVNFMLKNYAIYDYIEVNQDYTISERLFRDMNGYVEKSMSPTIKNIDRNNNYGNEELVRKQIKDAIIMNKSKIFDYKYNQTNETTKNERHINDKNRNFVFEYYDSKFKRDINDFNQVNQYQTYSTETIENSKKINLDKLYNDANENKFSLNIKLKNIIDTDKKLNRLDSNIDIFIQNDDLKKKNTQFRNLINSGNSGVNTICKEMKFLFHTDDSRRNQNYPKNNLNLDPNKFQCENKNNFEIYEMRNKFNNYNKFQGIGQDIIFKSPMNKQNFFSPDNNISNSDIKCYYDLNNISNTINKGKMFYSPNINNQFNSNNMPR